VRFARSRLIRYALGCVTGGRILNCPAIKVSGPIRWSRSGINGNKIQEGHIRTSLSPFCAFRLDSLCPRVRDRRANPQPSCHQCFRTNPLERGRYKRQQNPGGTHQDVPFVCLVQNPGGTHQDVPFVFVGNKIQEGRIRTSPLSQEGRIRTSPLLTCFIHLAKPRGPAQVITTSPSHSAFLAITRCPPARPASISILHPRPR
jgi:hypothetical protein